MGKDGPPAFLWYPRDFAAAMRRYRFTDEDELAYRRALDASFEAECYGVGTADEWVSWAGLDPGSAAAESFLSKLRQVTMECPDGTLVQLRQAQGRMEQEVRFAQAREYGRRGGVATLQARLSHPQASLKPTAPQSFAFASVVDSKEKERRPDAPSRNTITAECMARCRARFPGLDLPVIEAKLLAYHAEHPYRNLDRAFLGWCKSAETRGMDRKPTEHGLEAYVDARRIP